MRIFKSLVGVILMIFTTSAAAEVDVGWLLDDKFKSYHRLPKLAVDGYLEQWITAAEENEVWSIRDGGLVQGKIRSRPYHEWAAVLELCATFFALSTQKAPDDPVSKDELRMSRMISVWMDWELRKHYRVSTLASRINIYDRTQDLVLQGLLEQLSINVRRLRREIGARSSKPRYAERIAYTRNQCVKLSEYLGSTARESS